MEEIKTTTSKLTDLPHYTRNQIAIHNSAHDIWVSFLGKVFDLTELAKEYSGDILFKPILAFAGKDITHLFDKETREIKYHVDPVSDLFIRYTPHGRFVHAAPPCPRSDWRNDFEIPWWKDDEKYCIGYLSNFNPRKIKLRNMLTGISCVLEVSNEETLGKIRERYQQRFNSNAHKYTWMYFDLELDMQKTLDQNGIHDENELFFKFGMNEELYMPAIHLYFSDDLEEEANA